MEPGLQLLARIVAEDPHPGDDDLNELVSVIWMLLSRDYAADLSAKAGAASKTSFAAWDEVLAYCNQSRSR